MTHTTLSSVASVKSYIRNGYLVEEVAPKVVRQKTYTLVTLKQNNPTTAARAHDVFTSCLTSCFCGSEYESLDYTVHKNEEDNSRTVELYFSPETVQDFNHLQRIIYNEADPIVEDNSSSCLEDFCLRLRHFHS